MLRQAAINALIASYQARVTVTWDPRHGKQFLQELWASVDRDMPIDADIDRLRERFGTLPDEAGLRKTLEAIKEQRRAKLRTLIEQAR